MTVKKRVTATVSTHSQDTVKVEDGDAKALNHQDSQDLLLDPSEVDSGNTHSEDEPKRKVTKAALTDKEIPSEGNTHIPNDEDPAGSYLKEESGMPVINSGVDDEEFEDEIDEDEIESAMEDEEFGDLAEIESADGMDEFDAPEEVAPEPEVEEVEEVADFEAAPQSEEDVSIMDVDQVPEQDEADVHFASIGASVHVIRSNRIIASMGPKTANRNGIGDIYMSEQFQDVVIAAIERKGLRKGLVQAGFQLAKVKVSASKTVAKVIEAKVAQSLNKKVEAMAAKEAAMAQCLAIAAVGINRQFFKDAKNELKAALETELVHAGVRGGARIVRAMFAQHGVSYARTILTLATKLSAMPEEVRNQYADALDMTSDGDFAPEEDMDEVESAADEDMEEFEPFPSSVSAALQNPLRKDCGALLAGVKSRAAAEILSGTKSLI